MYRSILCTLLLLFPIALTGCTAETQQEAEEAAQETGEAIESAVDDAATATEGAIEGAREAIEGDTEGQDVQE
mgnify:CR=1 FL=1